MQIFGSNEERLLISGSSYILLLHRPIIYKPPAGASSGSSGPTTAGSMRDSANVNSGSDGTPILSRELPAPIASTAAKTITQHAREIANVWGDVRFIPLTLVSTVFAALSVQIVELRSGDAQKSAMARTMVGFNLWFLAEMSSMYPVSGWSWKLFTKILAEGDAERNGRDEESKQAHEGEDAVGRDTAVMKGPQGQPRGGGVSKPSGLDGHLLGNQHHQNMDNVEQLDPNQLQQVVNANIPSQQSTQSPLVYDTLHSSLPHYNPHHVHHNLYHSPVYLYGDPPTHQEQPHLTLSDHDGQITPMMTPTPEFNPFDIEKMEMQNSRRLGRMIHLEDPSPLSTQPPSAESSPPPGHHAGPNGRIDQQQKHLAKTWAKDVYLDDNLLNTNAGAMGSLAGSNGNRGGKDSTRQSHPLGNNHGGGSIIEEVIEIEEEENRNSLLTPEIEPSSRLRSNSKTSMNRQRGGSADGSGGAEPNNMRVYDSTSTPESTASWYYEANEAAAAQTAFGCTSGDTFLQAVDQEGADGAFGVGISGGSHHAGQHGRARSSQHQYHRH